MILVTGGAGYIGSHTCVELLNAGYELVIVDNLSNSKKEALNRVQMITGKSFFFYEIDLCNKEDLEMVFYKHQIDAVIHFAGLKAVGESVAKPLKYFKTNLQSTINLCEVMQKNNVKKLIFSSSATVYGMPEKVPIFEDFPLNVTNPYGRTKLIIEEILHDIHFSDPKWSISILRYFNPIGAHESGLIGEDPNGIPNNLMPYITKVAIGELPELQVFGNQYPTKDGTGVRDYIHVVDLAIGHLKALEHSPLEEVSIYNLGTGKGYSVLEIVQAFEKATGVDIPYNIVNSRPGDAAICFANASKANKELGWYADKTITQMCKDAWKWQSSNPNGYIAEHTSIQS
ncbi:UDP-glucose 4-epimerase GalE [Bacillus sp. AGMB 02131]|uniref:UDP-glucose 4-epimerase n=1 Tax=Peribacillus faecalis TaxID=2772559 RepID=A0A927H9K5_9BACI|nr:UDP-glucose 4-epimerase GalE [Peribacillus faecalis]MBD3107690.1 UDP-glucose 4-epimerase GalE [Peribacillus faecalis]